MGGRCTLYRRSAIATVPSLPHGFATTEEEAELEERMQVDARAQVGVGEHLAVPVRKYT